MDNKYELSYDKSDVDSILEFAKKLKGKTLRKMIKSEFLVKESKEDYEQSEKIKGKFGQTLQEKYFGIKNNSDSEPDFKEVGVELKSTPIKKLVKGGFSPKERLILNIIDYNKIIHETWENSHFLTKNEKLLVIIYLYENGIPYLDFLIKYVEFYKLEGKDREIIKRDWETIVNKIKNNLAHELSEGDTLYLGACRKGHHEEPKVYGSSQEPAKQRAFSFKPNFMKSLLRKIEDAEPLIKDLEELRRKDFEEIVYDKFRSYLGLNVVDIEKRLNLEMNKSYGYYAILARKMLGINSKRIVEFEKAEIQMKTIRLKYNGMPKEDMSFPAFEFNEVAKQDWEDSDFCDDLEKRFLFVIFQMNKDESEVIFKNAFFWVMPKQDLLEAQKVWEHAKKVVNEGIVVTSKGNINRNNLPKSSQNKVSHVRPHGKDKNDTDELPDGRKFVKSCFWLNKLYLKEQIEIHRNDLT